MLKIRYLVILTVAAYLIFLLARLPASWIAPHVNQALAQKSIGLTSVVGTVWSGSANLQSNATFLAPLQGSQLVWAIRFGGLWQGQLRVDFHVSGSALQLQGQAQLGWKQIGLQQTSGEVSAMLLNSILANTLTASQPLKLSNVAIRYHRSSSPSIDASGALFWPKGTVVLAQNPGRTLSMPDTIATLSSINSGLQLIAKAQDASVLTIMVEPTGMASITVWQHILGVLGLASGVTNPEAKLLELQQKLF